MGLTQWFDHPGLRIALGACTLAALLAGCGGGSSSAGGGASGGSSENTRDSGPQQTTLTVAASDADGDALKYEWRVTAGTVDNRNAPTTVWKLPSGPGLHFAYVTVGDGRGGYVQQQYAVSSDALEVPSEIRAYGRHQPPSVMGKGSGMRLRFKPAQITSFGDGGAGAREIYLPDIPVQVIRADSGAVTFTGVTDASGEVSLPQLAADGLYRIRCGHGPGSPLEDCGPLQGSGQSAVQPVSPVVTEALNLRLFGHIGFADGGVCGTQNEYFQQLSSASVQLLSADDVPITPSRRVNRYGDYMIEASVAVRATLRLRIQCEGYTTLLDVPPSPDASGYTSATPPIRLSYQIPNSRPVIQRMVANGFDGSVRGRMIVQEVGSASERLPGERQFLAYKGADTRQSACRYYRSFGMVKDCDAQGNMIEPMTMEEWKREHELPPHASSGPQASATYINKMDLNLVRRMSASKKSPRNIAFLVCNHPGPDGRTQREVDDVLDKALNGERMVACVGMEWSSTPGVNNNDPFTKFATFGPDGSLLASINLDGRGEKYLPGACVACHGGSAYNGRFPEAGNPSPYLGSRFLPFDTGNFSFGSAMSMTEPIQAQDLRRLNDLVVATEEANTPTRRLVEGWYASGSATLDHNFVPPDWQEAERTRPGAARFYREVVGSSCRTCHTALGDGFDWDRKVLTPETAQAHVCGGGASLATNASMPNALVTRDRLADKVRADPSLAALMRNFLGCDTPAADPVYPVR